MIESPMAIEREVGLGTEPDYLLAKRQGAVRELLLNIASVLGAVCIVLTVAALLFNITLIMFKTGSMSPTIPAGSLALVREIPASEVRVGDVVTVDRPDQLPVTHRVVAAQPGADGQSVLTLRGDANPVDDPAPYTVSTVRIVMASVPGLAFAVVAMSNPWALAAVSVVVASFITWYFWPRSTPRERRARGRHRARSFGGIVA
ncbi:signal peptidase I [Agreia sp. VKM Ac-1783]|jgi:signal peptidase|uniref:signal peptidase I n=1 Tax=Agreia sp. VKM Ac-1783 TaxID=1938889 RepID=UPI000A2AA3C1|nr:signal peptidase I [Agreia sp. VKM Ac-1783]SMQ59733.1 signal peptidase, endoplasmic reticulum-type [Agreia sp. VKM Ac-1783]